MSTVGAAAEMPAFPKRCVRATGTTAHAHIVIGTAGALTASSCVYDHPDITVTASGTTTGKYTITFPPCLYVRPSVSYVYASSTTCIVNGAAAPDAANGTWAIQFGTEANVGAWPASTDQFDICLDMTTEPA